ncbi:Rpn family recombination-promoting nuclease/putative transposase [Paenibacillus piri]
MALFFPQIYEAIDFNHVVFLSEEVFTDIVEGEKRRVDMLIETRLKEQPALIIVHLEAQAYYQTAFAERMFVYFSRLFEKYRCRILPIAVFSYDAAKEEPDAFRLEFPFMRVLDFQFKTVELRKNNWRDYIKQENPVAAALLSKMGYNEDERVQVKKEFLRMLIRLELDPAKIHLIACFFDTYLILNEAEKRQLHKEITLLHPREEERIMELKTAWEEDAELAGKLKGKIEGKIEGRLEGMIELIRKYMAAHFGESLHDIHDQLAQLTNLELVEQLADRLFRASRPDEARKLVEDTYEAQQKLNRQ